MASTDTRTLDPAQPHPSETGGHERSDFSFTSVMWLLPLSVVVLVAFILVCLYWFRGAKDGEMERKQALFVPAELRAYQARQHEILSSYQLLDRDKGRYRIPVDRAMALIAREHQDKPGRPWTPNTDSYLEGAAFARPEPAGPGASPAGNGISVEDVPAGPLRPGSVTKRATKTSPGSSQGAAKDVPGGTSPKKE